MTKTCGIYKITSPSGKIYIGQSIHIEKRFRVYRNMKGGRQTKLLHSLLKYGFNAHTTEIIHECPQSELNYWERFYIDVYNTFNSIKGMNLKAGGHFGGTLSEESKAKLRRPQSPEHREKCRIASINRAPVSEETREKHRQRMMGNQYLKGIRATSKTVYCKDKEGIILKFLCFKDCASVMEVDETSIYKSMKNKQKCKGLAFSYTV